ncbi:MAG: element excision factor XisI family protein [Anaerolineae bacterium]
MATFHEIVHRVLQEYAVNGANFNAYLTSDADGSLLTVVDVANEDSTERFVTTSIVVRLLGDYIVIEHDDNDKPLVDALLQAGVARAKIILAYAGEPVPDTMG